MKKNELLVGTLTMEQVKSKAKSEKLNVNEDSELKRDINNGREGPVVGPDRQREQKAEA